MKKIGKQILVIILVALFVIGAMPFSIAAEGKTKNSPTCSGTCGKGLTWRLDKSNGKLEIEGNGDIPLYSTPMAGTWAAPWYYERHDIRSIAIGEGVKTIGGYAFEECDNLQNVSLPSTLEKIGIGAFSGCKKLETVIIPQGVRTIQSDAFYECTALKQINLPNGVQEIG